MRALCWHGKGDIRCDTVADPKIENPSDVRIKVSSCAICGSDLHLMDGQMPTMESGDVLGHEFMGEIVEVGSDSTKFHKGQRIVVPFQITCGECRQCKMGNWSCCQRSNRNCEMAAQTFGYPTAGLYGYSHMTGGYWGGQAEYVRVPMADASAMAAPEGMSDDRLLFLTDILPTGWQAAEQCQIQGGEIIAIWGAGPVGLFAVQSAKIMGAERIIVIETVPERIALAKKMGATDVIDFENEDVYERIKEISKGEGADGVIDCVGIKATGAHGIAGAIYQGARNSRFRNATPVRAERGDQGRSPRRLRLRARRVWRPGAARHGLRRAEGPDDPQRLDQREALSRKAYRADPGRAHRHDVDGNTQVQGSRRRARTL